MPCAQQKLLLTVFIVSLFALPIAIAQTAEPDEPVVVYSYHLKPPFIINEKQKTGLYYEFSHYINRKLKKTWLRTEYIPRRRLDLDLAQPEFKGMVIGVNPLWFGDKDKQKYLWSSAILRDRDEILSPIARPVEYTQPKDLFGKTLGVVHGLYYFGISEEIARANINREEANSEIQNLEKLLRNRLDVTIISRSTLNYYVKTHPISSRIHISAKPHDEFDRQLLCSKSLSKAFEKLEPLVAKMSTDPEWTAIVNKYQ